MKKIFTKEKLIFLFLACLFMPFFSTCVLSEEDETLSAQLNATITREEFADFYETLVIEPEKNEELGIGEVNLKNFTFNEEKISLIQDELFSARSPYFEPDIVVKREKEAQKLAQTTINNQYGRSSITNVRISEAKPNMGSPMFDSESKSALEPITEPTTTTEPKVSIFEKNLKATASLLEKDKNSSKVRQELLELEIQAGQNGLNLSNVAKLYIKIGENDRAKDLLKRAELFSPDNYKVIYTYAIYLYKANELTNAEQRLVKVTKLKPGFMYAHYNLGNIYYRKKEYKKSIESFKKAMDLEPNNADTYFNIGLTLEAMGQKELARKFYSKTLQLNPNDKEASKAVERL